MLKPIPRRFIDRTDGEYNLIVPAGEELTLPAIDHFFDNVTIEEGGVLRIAKESENWTLIDCRKDFKLLGSIIFRQFASDIVERELVVADKIYKHTFRLDKLGGKGGNSGGGGGGTIQIFNGAPPTTAYGGGGAAGGYHTRRTGTYPGAHASGPTGGITSFSRGGDGGRRAPYSNGGIIFLNIGHDFTIGAKHQVDLRGEDGTAGTAGMNGRESSTQWLAGSGGGGGGPGGEGGVLYHRVKGEYSGAVLQPLVDGGRGGAGGAGGSTPSAYLRGGLGEPGNSGRQGHVKTVRD